MDTVFFILFAATALGAAVTAVSKRNPLTSAFALVVMFLALSGLYFQRQAPFIATLQILLYAGAIMVLVIFVIMFLNLPEAEYREGKLSRPGVLAALFICLPLGVLLVSVVATAKLPPRAAPVPDFGTTAGVGRILFERHLYPFEIISVLLLAAIVGTVLLARKRL